LPFAIPNASLWRLATFRHQQNFTGSILPLASTSYSSAIDLSGTTVEVLAIVAKSEAESWLAQFGNPE
jgi:hypothetical protein